MMPAFFVRPNGDPSRETTLAVADGDLSEEDARVIGWIHEQLHELHVSDALAEVAADCHVDWHQVEGMVRRGCSPDLAVTIVL